MLHEDGTVTHSKAAVETQALTSSIFENPPPRPFLRTKLSISICENPKISRKFLDKNDNFVL